MSTGDGAGALVREVDRTVEGDLRAWWEVRAATAAERPGDPVVPWAVERLAMADDGPERVVVPLVAEVDGAVVGAALARMPRNDNPHLAFLEVDVVPGARRAGVAGALLDALEARVRAAGRTTALVPTHAPPGQRSAAARFLEPRGYAVANREQVKHCDLAATRPPWPALRTVAEAAAHGYRVRTWDRPSDEVAAGVARLLSGFFAQVPMGEIDMADSPWDGARVQAAVDRLRHVGRRMLVAGAFAPDGTLVGISDVRVVAAEPRFGEVGLTIVDAAHRGHRLGMLLKLAIAAHVLDEHPTCEYLSTTNAETNTHMNAVNAQLGFVHVEDLAVLQKVL